MAISSGVWEEREWIVNYRDPWDLTFDAALAANTTPVVLKRPGKLATVEMTAGEANWFAMRLLEIEGEFGYDALRFLFLTSLTPDERKALGLDTAPPAIPSKVVGQRLIALGFLQLTEVNPTAPATGTAAAGPTPAVRRVANIPHRVRLIIRATLMFGKDRTEPRTLVWEKPYA